MELRRNDPVVIVLLTLGIFMATSCRDESMPRPRGFLRIDLPERQYTWFDTTWPYAFEYPAYALIQPRDQGGDERYWADIVFPRFNASVHLSYKGVDGNLDGYTEDAHTLAMKHISRATGIGEYVISRPGDQVYGLIYNISGPEAASPFQFYLTDSSRHFLRGALYFNMPPNNDSLAPVISFLEEDILHIIGSLRWEDTVRPGR